MFNNKVFKKLARRCVTLIEMMIVMFLIALITGVVAYNYRGSLEEGKAFKTSAGIEKLHTMLSLGLANDPSLDLSTEGWQQYLRNSPLVKDPNNLMRDGWGNIYNVSYDSNSHTITITSPAYEAYKTAHKGSLFNN